MLDWAHGLVLRSVAKGISSPSEALENLEATGLIQRADSDAPYRLTDAGRRALAAGIPSRLERIGNRVLIVSLGFLGVGWLVDSLT